MCADFDARKGLTTAPHPLARSFAAFLFDMDGTLLDSTAVANRVWRDWAESHGLDADQVLAVLHGVRVRDTVQRFATDAMDVDREAERITAAEIAQVDGIAEIARARPPTWARGTVLELQERGDGFVIGRADLLAAPKVEDRREEVG